MRWPGAMGGLQLGMPGGGSSSILMQLHPLAYVAGGLAILAMAVSRIVKLTPDHQPKWARRQGALVEFVSALVAIVLLVVAAVILWLKDVEPALQAPVLTVLCLLLVPGAGRALNALGHRRAWVWAIRHGDVVSHWVTRLALGGLLLCMAYVVWSSLPSTT